MANNTNHLKNLKPFKKGLDPRRNVTGENRKPILDDLLAEVLTDPVKGIEAAKAILLAIRDKALKGDIRAAEMLFNRAYGLPKQQLEHNMFVEQPLFPETVHPKPTDFINL